MWLQNQRCRCMSKKVAAGVNMQLKESMCSCETVYDNMSQDLTAGAMMRLQEQDVAAGVHMWLQDKLLASSFSSFCRNFRFFRFRVFLSRCNWYSLGQEPIKICLTPAVHTVHTIHTLNTVHTVYTVHFLPCAHLTHCNSLQCTHSHITHSTHFKHSVHTVLCIHCAYHV